MDSALKDMAIVMKQQNRPEEAIEAIKSLRARCSEAAQESLDNVLLDLYKVPPPPAPHSLPSLLDPFGVMFRLLTLDFKAPTAPLPRALTHACFLWYHQRCGRLDDQILLLQHKLDMIHSGNAFNGKRTKTARSQGKKFQVSIEQEATRLLVNFPPLSSTVSYHINVDFRFLECHVYIFHVLALISPSSPCIVLPF